MELKDQNNNNIESHNLNYPYQIRHHTDSDDSLDEEYFKELGSEYCRFYDSMAPKFRDVPSFSDDDCLYFTPSQERSIETNQESTVKTEFKSSTVVDRTHRFSPKCQICRDISNGFHYGVFACTACRLFYNRINQRKRLIPSCPTKSCPITPSNRSNCPECRYQKCISLGMSRLQSRFGRVPRLAHSHEERIELARNSLIGKIRSFQSKYPEPSVDQIRDLYSQSIGILDHNNEYSRFRFLIADKTSLLKMAKFFQQLFSNPSQSAIGFESETAYLLKCVCFLIIMTKFVASENHKLISKLNELIRTEMTASGQIDRSSDIDGLITHTVNLVNQN